MKPSDIKILAVDDEQMILDSVAYLFKSFKFNVDTACSGNAAWELLEKNSYDLVLTDIRMPDGDGIELVKKIKARKVTRPSVLFMSGFSDVMNEQIYHFGAEGKFTKPFNIAAVRTAIQTCLMAPEAKWSQPLPEGRFITIGKKGKTIADLENQRAVVFGRGGFFISHEFTPPEKGKSISFSIQIDLPQPVKFQGVGTIRWIQTPGKSNVPPGLGIEITHLPNEQAKNYQQLFGHLTPFIPSLGKQFQDLMVGA